MHDKPAGEVPTRPAPAIGPTRGRAVNVVRPRPDANGEATPPRMEGPRSRKAALSRLVCARKWLGITGAWKLAEEIWHEARLIPTSGISGADEQERRATSAL